MERLYKLTFTFIVIVLAVQLCGAQDQCSLRVRVLSPEGHRVNAVVAVHEQGGRTLEQDHQAKDLVFCDLGILPVTVEVHVGPTCNKVEIENLALSLKSSYLLKVMYDPKNCSHETFPPLSRTCNLLIRVQGQDGKNIPDADIHFATPKEMDLKADHYGRLLVAGSIGKPVEGNARASGFGVKDFSFSCQGYEPQEESVKLPPGE